MAQLPLVIKRDVRDKFDASGSAIQQQFITLKDTLGLPIRVDISWSLLWTEYEKSFVDKSTFVPYIIPYVATLLDALISKLDEDNAPWTDKFLELLTQNQSLRLDLQTCRTKDASVRWLDGSLILYMPLTPATASAPSNHSMLDDLANLFAEPLESSSPTRQASRSSTLGSVDDITTPMSSLSFSSDFPVSRSNLGGEASPIPRLEGLARPDQLFSQTKPYIISMRIERDRQRLVQSPANQYLPDRMILQSTHEQSLKLIHDYFTKWARPDMQTREKVPLMRHTLCPPVISHTSFDTLVIEPFSQVSARSGSILNPALYQCFIEGVLGYETVYRGISEGYNVACWEFRRIRPFA